MLKGIGASQGYGIGNAVVISDAKLDYNHVEFTTAQNEKERLQKAVDTFIKETRKLADDVKNSAGDKEAEILEGHIVMLSDPFMLSQMQDNIDAGSVAERLLIRFAQCLSICFRVLTMSLLSKEQATLRISKTAF